MFIEGLRRAKNKWRIVVGILMGLIIISLLLTFANFGNKVDSSGIAKDSSPLGVAETTAENTAASAKAADGDMTVQGEAAAAYLSLAAYQNLYLEDPAKSYEQALVYAQNMVEACGSVKDPDYETAYTYKISALAGIGDAEKLSAAFNESLSHVELSQGYLQAYAQAMMKLDANEQLVTDLTAAQEQIAANPDKKSETAENEDEAAVSEEPQDLSSYIDTLITQAQEQ